MTNHTDTPIVDLEIRIFRRNEDGYPVEITLGGQQEFAPGLLDAGIVPWTSGGDPAQDGQRLFEAFLADADLRSAWDKARAQAPHCRIRLRIDPAAAELHTLPWELLSDGPAMLAAQATTPFSRYLPIALPWREAVGEGPLRVLVAIANPDDLDKYKLASLDVDAERKILEAAFATLDEGQLEVTFLDAPVTLKRLEDALREGYHVLHFVGHGAFSQRRGQAALFMQDAMGQTHIVPDSALVSMLARQNTRPQLVTLMACQSATRDTADAFAGLGPKLVAVGVPAVVAMQDVVAIETARVFEGTFYRRLLDHGYVDQAMNEARSTLLTAEHSDAAVPVLFMRLKSGQLWGAEVDARGKIGSKKPEAFWLTLVKQIERKRCTPIVGPRVHGRVLPTQREIAERWADHYAYPFHDRDELSRVAQFVATIGVGGERFLCDELLDMLMTDLKARLPEALQPDGYVETLTELVQAVGWSNLVEDNPNDAHRVLADLDLPLYLTTNPDSFMVEALNARGRAPVRELCRWNEDLDWLDSRLSEDGDYVPTVEEPLVYHFFGSDEEVDSLVISEDHYYNFLVRTSSERDRIPSLIRDALSRTTLMFVGYSLYDWEFRVLMHGLVNENAQRGRSRYNHVAVQLELADLADEDIDTVRDFLQEYMRSVDIDVYWGSTAQFVAELREYWEARRR